MLMRLSVFLSLLISVTPVKAGEADILAVDVKKSGSSYVFSVTVKHSDTGWDHYADRWEVVGPDGTVYGSRVLAHPHVDEQPFTRQGNITIPEGVSEVTVRANDGVHGLGGAEIKVSLPAN